MRKTTPTQDRRNSPERRLAHAEIDARTCRELFCLAVFAIVLFTAINMV